MMMTSLLRHLQTLNTATLPLKFSCNGTACCYYIFVGQKINANQIHIEMHPMYDDKCIRN